MPTPLKESGVPWWIRVLLPPVNVLVPEQKSASDLVTPVDLVNTETLEHSMPAILKAGGSLTVRDVHAVGSAKHPSLKALDALQKLIVRLGDRGSLCQDTQDRTMHMQKTIFGA